MHRPLQPLLCRAFGLLLVAPLLSGCALLRGPIEPTRLTLLDAALPAAVAADPILSPASMNETYVVAPEPVEPRAATVSSPENGTTIDSELETTTSVQEGVASFYASFFHGRKTASGVRYDEKVLSAAHRTLPLGTKVRVTNLANDRDVELTVNDRGPYVGARVIDLSLEAARQLGFVQKGLARVRVEVLQPAKIASTLP
jgi:rare lipoprotein A